MREFQFWITLKKNPFFSPFAVWQQFSISIPNKTSHTHTLSYNIKKFIIRNLNSTGWIKRNRNRWNANGSRFGKLIFPLPCHIYHVSGLLAFAPTVDCYCFYKEDFTLTYLKSDYFYYFRLGHADTFGGDDNGRTLLDKGILSAILAAVFSAIRI